VKPVSTTTKSAAFFLILVTSFFRDDPMMTGRVLLDLLDMTSLVTATVPAENNNRINTTAGGAGEKLANGVNIGTNYRVYGIDKVTTTFVQLRSFSTE
jgi:hypothetical protein